jgi:hypothetical protein
MFVTYSNVIVEYSENLRDFRGVGGNDVVCIKLRLGETYIVPAAHSFSFSKGTNTNIKQDIPFQHACW